MPKLPYRLLLAAALAALASLPDAWCSATAAPTTQAPVVKGEIDCHDISPEREAHYTRSVIKWLEGLPDPQRERARKILREAHPEVHALRVRIRETKARLEALRFDSATPTDTLPRIGMELQRLRAQLRKRLLHISELLRSEVGVSMGPVGEEGFWLNPGGDGSHSGTRVSVPARN